MAGVVQEEQLLLQQQQQQDPRPIQRRYRFIALLGASMVLLFSVVGKPSVQVHADTGTGCALTGFLLWLLGATRLLLFAQVRLHPLFPAGLAAATAKFSLVLERMKRLFFARQDLEPAAAPA